MCLLEAHESCSCRTDDDYIYRNTLFVRHRSTENKMLHIAIGVRKGARYGYDLDSDVLLAERSCNSMYIVYKSLQ